jgi:glycosyltransferase involved in cell wall biosynthesis
VPSVRHRKLVYTLYDAWSLYPNNYQSSGFQKIIGRRMLKELRCADAIVCISEATRARLLDLNVVDPVRCHVALMGVAPPSAAEPPKPGFTAKLAKPFALFVGRIEVRKNLEHVISAVSPIDGLNLVIVGEPGYGYDRIEREVLAAFPSERLHRLSRVPRCDLDWLCRNALAALLPSWEEGFGLPILEAMVRGCPVITSNCSASAEVAAGAGIVVDPNQPEQSETALRKIVAEPDHRSELAQAGIAHCQQFSWRRYFSELTKVYRELAGG